MRGYSRIYSRSPLERFVFDERQRRFEMRRNAYPIRNGLRFDAVLAALLCVTTLPASALGSDRVVLGEELMATW